MAEQKKRGFHALEQRIHEMEKQDAKSGAPAQVQTAPPAVEPAKKPEAPRKK